MHSPVPPIRPWLRRRFLALAAAALAGAGCASIDQPQRAAHLPSAVSVAPNAAGATADLERKRLVDTFGGEYHDAQAETYLNGVLLKLAPASGAAGEPYRVTLLDSPVVNAFALPSGDIFMTRGLIALAGDTSEIAAVMAHEIAHVTARHAAQRAEFERTAALFTRVNAQVLRRAEAEDEIEARSKLSIARFSRQQEFEADQIGIKTIAKAGYDPYGAARFLNSLGEWSALAASTAGASNPDRPDMMATHPSTPERIAQATAEARQVDPPAQGARGREAWLAAIDGLAFGDDPAQGVVRGTTFIHPKLGFAFEAPEGFTLENQTSALIGVGQAGSVALRLDSVAIPDSTPVAAAIQSGWIDGVKTSSVETVEIGGLEAATAVAKGEQWSFRLGAIRLNGRLYRLIFAAHALSPAVDAEFLKSLRSFHLINAEDSTLAAAQSIRLVAAGPADTSETLAERMAFLPKGLDQFLILNGLERGQPLVQGQRYKVITR